MDKQVLVVGWDGATESHLDEYDLEWYGGLDHGGVLLPEPFWQSREIDSGSAWTTLTTGLSTREHGVAMLSGLIEDERRFDLFSSVDRLIPRNLFGRPARIWARRQVLGRQPTNDDVPYKRVWHYVPDSLAFAVPLTYPPKETDGVTVSGFPSPEVSVQPESLEAWVRERYDGEPSKFDDAGEIRDGYVEDLFRTHEAERDLVLELVEREEFRLHFVVFTLLDRLLHVTDDAEVIERAYRTMDETSDRLVDAIDPDDVLVVSDHGMKHDPRGKWIHVHDETTGIWAGTRPWGVETHLDVTPALVEYCGRYMGDPTYTAPETDAEREQMTSQLRDLGYL
ncbi:alkaline phosphatase family protein [Halobacteria archaeon HArc-gm2]|nr:alkaline phosphatase family protein [Halobacteria archaeon HArc-gm2]